MGFYIRKSFRAGPVRLNLSKSGVGVSAGIKGLRIGSGPRGSYIHAGRGGLYYRKSLGNNKKYHSASQDSIGFIGGLGVIIALVILIKFFVENPVVLLFLVIAIALVAGALYYKKISTIKMIEEYKKALDNVFVLETTEFSKDILSKLKKKMLIANRIAEAENIEKDIYQALLDKIIDDNQITPSEREAIRNLESIVSINESYRKESKIELFKSYYLNAIADRLITNTENETLKNIIEGLEIDHSDIIQELQTVSEIVKMQGLSYPLDPLTSVPIPIQKSEIAFYCSTAKVLSRKKAPRNTSSQYEYSIRREGNLVVTNKRVLVVNEGTTSVNINDILDIDVDIDNKSILISKGKSETPTIIQTEEALFCGKIIDIIKNNTV